MPIRRVAAIMDGTGKDRITTPEMQRRIAAHNRAAIAARILISAAAIAALLFILAADAARFL